MLRDSSKRRNLSPKDGTVRVLYKVIGIADEFLADQCNKTDEGYFRAVTALAKVEQELKLMEAAEALKNSKDISD